MSSLEIKSIDLGTYLLLKNILEIMLISYKAHIINMLSYFFRYGLALLQTCLPAKAGAHKKETYI